MSRIPAVPLCLGLAGLIPFLWGALSVLVPSLALWGAEVLGARFVGPYVSLAYGAVILAFMSGVLWGFATKAHGRQAAICYTLSVLPALWAFFGSGGGPRTAGANLAAGFLALLLLDRHFVREGLAPDWWMPLRGLLTAVVVLCYLPIVL